MHPKLKSPDEKIHTKFTEYTGNYGRICNKSYAATHPDKRDPTTEKRNSDQVAIWWQNCRGFCVFPTWVCLTCFACVARSLWKQEVEVARKPPAKPGLGSKTSCSLLQFCPLELSALILSECAGLTRSAVGNFCEKTTHYESRNTQQRLRVL